MTAWPRSPSSGPNLFQVRNLLSLSFNLEVQKFSHKMAEFNNFFTAQIAIRGLKTSQERSLRGEPPTLALTTMIKASSPRTPIRGEREAKGVRDRRRSKTTVSIFMRLQNLLRLLGSAMLGKRSQTIVRFAALLNTAIKFCLALNSDKESHLRILQLHHQAKRFESLLFTALKKLVH